MEYVKNKARYSRADLLALRYEANAQQRPNCANKFELQTLSFWKIIGLPTSANVNSSSNNTCYVNKSGISPDRDRESINLNSSTNVLSSRRALRNRERAHNYYQRFSSSEQQIEDSQGQSQIALIPGSVSSNISSYKTTAQIDQRSISSSHLMPAFAKRRFVTVSGGGSCNEASNESQQVKVNSPLMIYTDRSLNPKDVNADIKAQLRHHNNSLGSGSPIEWERTEKQSNSQRCHDKSLTLSPTFQSLRQQGTGISTQERRIGSGRLLPRNDNWEFKNQETDASKSNLDNDQVQNGSISSQHRAFSCKANDKSNDNLPDRDRRREDSKKNAASTRRVFNKDKFNFMESANQSINRGRRGTNNLYHQSHDAYEPEWFSAGPTSQHETIDLHGFEDIESEEQPSKTDASLKDPNETSNKQIGFETTATIGSRSSSVGSLIQIESSNYDIMDSNATAVLGDPQNKHHNHICQADVEFNFDAFLSMDPMDHSLMRKEGEVHRQITETSRFSRWFSPNEPASNNEITLSSTLETQEIPSVKDLEAQMKKVNLRAEYLNVNSLTNSLKPIHTTEHSDDKSLPRDTEAFKRLLQQLGSQTSGHPVADSYLINVTAVRGGPIANAQDLYKPIAQIKKDEILSYQQQRIVKNDSNTPHGHNNDSMQLPQNLLQTPVMPSPLDAILPGPEHGSLPLQTLKRVDVQHLLQSVIRGDVSFEFLEKELNNPNITAQSREMIATVLFEYTNSGRFVAQQKFLNLHNDASPTNVVKNYPLLNRNHGALVSEDLFSNISNQVTNQHQQPLRHSNSPTPLAFTPTSVLRKMTADKETTSLYSNTNNAINYQQQQYHQNYHQLPTSFTKCSNVHNMMNDSSVITAGINLQPRMILGGNYAIQNQNQLNNPQVSPKILPHQMSQSRGQQTSKWPPASKSYGRPILKGNMNSALTVSSFNNMQHQINQQRLKSMQQTDAINSESVQGSGSPQQNIHNDGISQQIQHQHYLQQQQQQQSRLRLMHGDLQCPNNIPIKSSASIIGGGTDDKSLMNNRLSPLNYHRDDHLPPTANKLSQWFSPELLARASAGKLPLLNMNQALSLEEFERNIQHSSATVLN